MFGGEWKILNNERTKDVDAKTQSRQGGVK